MSRLKHVSQPLTVGKMKLKNRLVMLPMAIGYVEEGRPTERLNRFLAERAEGGVGLIITSVNPSSPNLYHLAPSVSEESFLPQLRKLVESVHAYGVPIVAELVRLRKFARTKDEVPQEVGPSPVAEAPRIPIPRALTIEEIQHIVEEYGESARRCREAGFDGVEILAGAGNILSMFISPVTNKRKDGYGGSLANRMRFLLECIDTIRKKAGNDYSIGVRYSAHEFLDGGYDLDGGQEIARILEKAGVDWLDLQVGWHASAIPLITKEVPEGHWAYLAEGIKKAVSIPVMATYRISDPVVAERILAKGQADLIGMARAFVADPQFADKAIKGKFNDIRYCMCCCRCIDQVVAREVPLELCSVNPRIGKELDAVVETAHTPKKVVIVGGGPAGMEAARVAALRGHRPMIFDKNSRLGGLMILGSILDPEVEKVLKYQTAQIKKLGVKVRLETEANLDLILNENPDVVIVAGGGIAPPAGFPGEDGKNVFTLRDARAFLLGRSLKKRGGFLGPLGLKYFYRPSLIRSLMRLNYPFGRRVVIIGGKFGGFEFADILAQKGKVVTILEKSERLGSDIGPATRFVVMGRMKKFGVRMETNVKVLEINKKGIKAVIVTKDGADTPVEIEADSVIVTVDLEKNEELAQQLKGSVSFVYLVGDATERRPISPPNMWGPLQPRRIGEAIKAGYQSAIEL